MLRKREVSGMNNISTRLSRVMPENEIPLIKLDLTEFLFIKFFFIPKAFSETNNVDFLKQKSISTT